MTTDKVTKVTISVPSGLFNRLEQERRRLNLTRSALFSELAARLVRELEDAELEAQYAAGYEKHPEGSDDLAWVADASAATLAAVAAEDPHDWSEDYRLDSELRAAG
jgi:hypothetical protein